MDRVVLVAEELGIAVDPSGISYGIGCVSDKEFIDFFADLFARFGSRGKLDTCRPNDVTVSLLLLCYRRPPKLAFVWLYGRRAEVVVPPRKGYFFELDRLSGVFGPKVEVRVVRIDGNSLSGCYVPISCGYLVTDRVVGTAEPKYVVKGPRSFHVYPSAVDPVPYNLLGLLRLWNGK